jgi:hypothetical protein
VVAWGYLVYAAIDFGATARGGESQAWWFLAVSSFGAVACLFIGLMLVARLLRRLGISGGSPEPHPDTEVDTELSTRPSGPPRVPGGRRAAR